jgi:3-methyladenine DNA glycosylase AlkC
MGDGMDSVPAQQLLGGGFDFSLVLVHDARAASEMFFITASHDSTEGMTRLSEECLWLKMPMAILPKI